jgi:hypothetical protein
MLRGMLEDLPSGIIKIPLKELTEYGISIEELDMSRSDNGCMARL